MNRTVGDLQSDLLQRGFSGEASFADVARRLYATDASEYQEMPIGVAWPKTEQDVRHLILWANTHKIPLIPRTAGTSLAGQCVGSGMVMDLSRHFTKIHEIHPGKGIARVQPGVIRNHLNLALASHGLFFGPETSTANRAMIGGMVGNNSCGSNSVVYGSTRDHLLSVRGFLSDGSEVTFTAINSKEFHEKCNQDSLEGSVYRTVRDLLSDPKNRQAIENHFPLPSIPRRNTGYALDLLAKSEVFDLATQTPFNFCQLIAGSEGTLFIAVEITLSCSPLPPAFQAVVCGHFQTIHEALTANLTALEHNPSASELIDRHILECSKLNLEQARNRDFIEGDPGAILVMELRRDSEAALNAAVTGLLDALRSNNLGYAHPVLKGSDVTRIWDLRRAGQAVMNNIEGEEKPREVAEDTAVDVKDLPAYILEFDQLMQKHGIRCVYYGHAATGELHMRPIFSLNTKEGIQLFRRVGEDVAALVKKYRGSLSGEHGDGRLRGEFLQLMVGPQCYEMMRQVKNAFDPHALLNPGKIIDTPPMDQWLRHGPEHAAPEWLTAFVWKDNRGILGAAEKCNGAGECRKTHLSGGTMCPSYMATRKEEDSTRGRANLLRQLMTEQGEEALAHPDLHRVLDLCLSCKGCKSECPSNVDLAKLKAEFLHRYQQKHGISLRSRLIAHFSNVCQIAGIAPWVWNFVFGTPPLRRLANRMAGFHPDRTVPPLSRQPLKNWFRQHRPHPRAGSRGKVFLFADEFTNYQDAAVGIHTVELLEKLGYAVGLPEQCESGRAALSKGLLNKARRCAAENVEKLHPLVCAETPLIGIEPSALLTFRDEYPDLLRGEAREKALALAPHCLLLEEFLAREKKAGRIDASCFHESRQVIRLHGHCHQKALVGMLPTIQALELVPGHDVRLIPSGCCGMAGSFGYEQEHFALSQDIGELVLFPTVRQEPESSIVCAPGTSCRHQIHDGTGRQALHPAEILARAVR